MAADASPAPVPAAAAAATCRHARTHTHPRAPTRAHTQHNLLSLSPPLCGVAGCRSLNQARPILPTPSRPRRATIASPATLSAPRLLHNSPFPASPLPRAGATIALGVGFRGMGPAVADVMWVVVLPFYKFRPPPSLLQQRPSILRPQHPQRPRRQEGLRAPGVTCDVHQTPRQSVRVNRAAGKLRGLRCDDFLGSRRHYASLPGVFVLVTASEELKATAFYCAASVFFLFFFFPFPLGKSLATELAPDFCFHQPEAE